MSRTLLAVGAVFLVSGVVTVEMGASAQVPPVPIPEPPDELGPVIEVLGPVVSPKCADAQAVIILGAAVAGGDIHDSTGIDIVGATAPVTVVCGMVPTPENRYRCVSDDLVRQAAERPTMLLAGLPLPFDVAYLAQIVGTTYEVQNLVPDGALPPGLLDGAADTLSCAAEEPSDENGEVPPVAPPVTLPDRDADSSSAVSPPASADTAPTMPTRTSAAPTLPGSVTESVETADDSPETSQTTEFAAALPLPVPRFQYPAIFLVPLALIGAATYVGRALTRPLDT